MWSKLPVFKYSTLYTFTAVVFYLACAGRLREDDMGQYETAYADDSYSKRDGRRRLCSRE
jgi:hypothetical protein